MSFDPGRIPNRLRRTLKTSLMGPQILAFLPALMLGGYWYGGEGLLMYMALLFPGLFAMAGLFSKAVNGPDARDNITGLRLRAAAVQALDGFLTKEAETGLVTAALVAALDDIQSIDRQFGTKARTAILKQTAQRIQSMLRDADIVVRLDDATYGIVLSPMRRSDLETLIQLSARIQSVVAEPYSVDATHLYVSISIGFCPAGRLLEKTGDAMLEAAEDALAVALVNGAGSIRAYSPEYKRRAQARFALRDEVASALETGLIQPWFQPQISTDTGAITGFQALPRWEHPDNGIILYTDFLESLTDMGLNERLGEILIYHSFNALRDWDKLGHSIPDVSVGFSTQELENPKICEKIRWELDRFELTPERLCVEIPEDLIADSSSEVITQNIWALSELGCRIELGGFGTGHASVTNIRRFAINRIKIDRSFITRVDRDREQQNMVAALLTMAERLEIDTLADGVETVGEHAMLAQLGCAHVQGFSVARPMPISATPDWISNYQAKQPKTVSIGRKTGLARPKATSKISLKSLDLLALHMLNHPDAKTLAVGLNGRSEQEPNSGYSA